MTAALALTLVFAANVNPANAATMAELETLIAQLQAQISGTVTTSSSTPFTWTGSLIKMGSRGAQVSALQSCMNNLGYSTGVVDGIYGANTSVGIKAFQASKGYMVDGIVGAQTAPGFEAACNGVTATPVTGTLPEGCTASTGYSTTTGMKCDTTSTETPVSSMDGTEGSVSSYSLGSPDETEALEGQSDVEIYALDVELDDEGDLRLDRVDVWFAQTFTGDEQNPWDYFKSVSLLVDGKEVASEDADSSSDWSDAAAGNIATDNAGTDKEYRMLFSGLDEVFKANQTTVVSIAVTMVNTIDTTDQTAIWYVEIDDDSGFKFTDGTGFTFTTGGNAEGSFGVDAEEVASIDISLSANDLDSSVLEVNDSVDTDDKTIAIFNVEEGQDLDVTIDTITAELTIVDPAGGIDPAGVGTIVKKAYLVVDGDVIGTESVSAAADAVTVTFDNLNWDLAGKADQDVSVVVDFYDTNDSARYDNGTTITVTDFDITEIEDENGNDEGDITTLTFATDSETHELRDEGIMVSFVGSSYNKTASTTDNIDGTVEFTLEFDVTAFGDDMWVDKTCAIEDSGVDVDATEVSLDGDADFNNTSCTDFDSTGDAGTDGFEVKDGTKETFTVTILGLGGEAGADNTAVTFKARLNGIGFNVGTDAVGDTVYAFDLADYESSAVTVYDRTA